ncbi:MAG: efflux transporter periplasmic adaptor subunit, partial [Mesorhizobium sp.]
QRPVEIGQLVGTLRVITKGVAPDDRVLVSGLSTAVPGQKIEPQEKNLEAAATDGAAQ